MSSWRPGLLLSLICSATMRARSSRRQDHRPLLLMDAETLVQLVAADAAQVVAAVAEEERVDEAAGVLQRGRIARTKLLVHLDEAGLLVLSVVSLQRGLDVLMIRIGVDLGEESLRSRRRCRTQPTAAAS